MRRASAAHNPGVSLFPFLAVLICTMGVMMLLLVIINRPGAAALDDSTPPPDAVFEEGGNGSAAILAATRQSSDSDSAAADKSLQADRDLLKARISKLDRSRAKSADDLRSERLRLATLEDGMKSLRDKWEQVKKFAGELQDTDTAKQHDVDEIAAAIAELKANLGAAHDQIVKAVDAARVQPPAYAIVPYDGASGTRRQPIYIECRSDAIVLQPEGIEFGPEDFKGPSGPGNPLASTVHAARDYLVGGSAPVPGREPYPLLIVRSDGIMAFYLARSAMQSSSTDYGYELVDADQKLVYQQPIPQLAQIERAALADARSRNAWFAANDSEKHSTERRGGSMGNGSGGGVGGDGSSGGGSGSSSGSGGFAFGNSFGGPIAGHSLYTSGAGIAGAGQGGLVSATGPSGIGGAGAAVGTGAPGGAGGYPGAVGIGGSGTGASGPNGSGGYAGTGGGNGFGAPGNGRGIGGNGIGTVGGPAGTGRNAASIAGGTGTVNPGPGGSANSASGAGMPGSGNGNGLGNGLGNGTGGGSAGAIAGDASAGIGGGAGGGPAFVPGSNYFGLPGGVPAGASGSPVPSGYGSGYGAAQSGSAINGSGTGNGSGSSSGMNVGTGVGTGGNANLAGGPSYGSAGPLSGIGAGLGTGANGVGGGSGGAATYGALNSTASPGSFTGSGLLGGSSSSSGNPNSAQPANMLAGVTLAQAGDSHGNSGSPGGDDSGGGGSNMSLMMNGATQQPKQSSDVYNTTSVAPPDITSQTPHPGEWDPTPPQQNQSQPQKPPPDMSSHHDPLAIETLAEKRGRNWSLPSTAKSSTPISRTIHIVCRGDCLIIEPGIGNPQPKVIPFGPRTADSVDRLVAAVWDYTKGWGIAGRHMYWKPTLELELGQNGANRFGELQTLMTNSGLEIIGKQSATAAASENRVR